MMLHEAVMLEIYRQALNASELASPRCQSRESSGSGGRCPSDDSNISGNGSTTAPTPTSPVGINLPATLPPAAAAALLPPQSAAMAAYLNAAAAAAQQNRLFNPLAAAAALHAAQSPSNLPLQSSLHEDAVSILDFSTKRIRRDSDTDSKEDSDAVNLSGKSNNSPSSSATDNAPLDLSCAGRKRGSESESPKMQRKMSRPQDFKASLPASWVPPINPYLAAVAAASLSPKNHLSVDWNGKTKIPASNDATKALEKMSEMTRMGGSSVENEHPIRNTTNHQTSNTSGPGSGSTGRHSAWQSHWLNKGADAAKDVFKCVWCKQSFPTLATLTTHMKETQHCGVNIPPSNNLQSQQNERNSNNSGQHSHSHHHQSSITNSSNSSSKSDLNLLIKETMPLPRKLVRGQDVWLGKGAEQTRQILKCMWCGQSFRSLAEMTSHMQETQHYTNIISQEQIISWKSSEEGKGSGANSGSSGNSGTGNSNVNSSTNSTVSAVLTCKVCDQAFSSLKDLSNHMVKNSHYKEHIMRSITESGSRRRQTREKRKKSLPVRKLLELERAQNDFKNGDPLKGLRMGEMTNVTTRITCEKCGDKIETALFVEHIRQCVGGSINSSARSLKSELTANSIISPHSLVTNSREGRRSIGRDGAESTSPLSNRLISPHTSDLASPVSSKDGVNCSGGEKSVLNAIEQLIEKSFDSRPRHNTNNFSASSHHATTPLGSNILKRLGIDENVDYTKPLIDPQTMNLLRSYQNPQFHKRERSGSESSSVSERGSSRFDSMTPEKKPDISNHMLSPRQSPLKTNPQENELEKQKISIKPEPFDEDYETNNINKENNDEENRTTPHIKKEPLNDQNETELDLSKTKRPFSPDTSASPTLQPRNLSCPIVRTPTASPSSDRSITPRSSTNSVGGANDKKPSVGSLNALSSMFDNLTGTNVNNNSETQSSSNKTGSSNPLAALQKLCDKTENNPTNSRSSSTGIVASNMSTNNSTGNILAFSWACNDAVMTSDSVIKCAFCDTPFCSKGAYRHHLSKVHFVKEETDSPAVKSPGANSSASDHQRSVSKSRSQSPKLNNATLSSTSAGTSACSVKSPAPQSPAQNSSTQQQQNSTTSQSPFDESPHSKFLKYTELAKQLSSKYV